MSTTARLLALLCVFAVGALLGRATAPRDDAGTRAAVAAHGLALASHGAQHREAWRAQELTSRRLSRLERACERDGGLTQ